jgi:hypothetical protein
MKRIIYVILITSFAFFSNTASSQDYKMALGVRLSSSNALVNNSVSFKYFLNNGNAIEGLFSFSNPVAIGGLYEVHRPLGAPGLQWFFGAGAYVAFNKTNFIGGQGIVGLDYKFQNIPLNISIDWKPELNLAREVFFEASGLGFSVRFTIK